MKSVAAFVMRGRVQAISMACAFLVGALLMTPLVIISGAIIGLVALRQGPREGLLATIVGGFSMAALGQLVLGNGLVLLLTAFLVWLPMLLLGIGLRASRSLALTLEMAALVAVLLVALQYLFLADPGAYWSEILKQLLEQMQGSGQVALDPQQMANAWGPWMVGGAVAGWFIELTLALFIARYWQAALYNPGGFRAEFHALRFSRTLMVVAPVLLLGAMLQGSTPGLLGQMSLVAMAALTLQGVATAHGLVAIRGASTGWLVGFYLFLFMAMPISMTMVSAAGFADGWLDLRGRARRTNKSE